MPAQNIGFFDNWTPGYGGATVTIYIAGTTTLASVFTNEGLTVAADNPQTLSSMVDDGITYGKWAAPLYTSQAVFIEIDNINDTGIIRPPLTDLDDEDASLALVTGEDGTEARSLAERADDFLVALDYGALGATAATNNTTLTAAIGAAAAAGGGVVELPAGTYPFTGLTEGAGVRLRGKGRGITILQCQTGGNCITLNGDRSGLEHLTLDGVNTVASSVGVFSKANDETVFDDVDIKRFVTGLHCKGGRRPAWRELYLTNNTTGAKLHGDDNAGGGADGDEFLHMGWIGGVVSQNTSIGVDLSFEDMKCWHNALRNVGFKDNTGTALKINGARFTNLFNCWFEGNTTTLAVLDDGDTDNADINTVIGLHFHGGKMDGGAVTFNDTCQDIVLDGMEITNVDFTLTSVDNNILFRDCIEDDAVTIAGDGTKITRIRTINKGGASAVTTGSAATAIWKLSLLPGELAYLVGKILANQRNGIKKYGSHKGVHAHRPGSTLAYDTQTANFTVGDLLTGATSGATARILADSDSGATGTLTLRDIDGEFEDNEIITDESTGSATVNGTLSHQNAALLGSVVDIKAPYQETVYSATFAANGPEVELQATGAASETIEWLGEVDVAVG